MKRLSITFVSVCLTLSSMAQNHMIVEKTDGSTSDFLTTDIKRVYFEAENTPEPTNVAEAIDLGLSVKWASFNIGATKPEEDGDFFAWAELEPKEMYTFGTYLYRNTFLGTSICGTPYDAAYVKWGGSWRMPTIDELRELFSQCTSTFVSRSGTAGRYFTGPNGNSIFLPAAGEHTSYGFEGHLRTGNYWSGTMNLNEEALYVDFDSGSLSPWGDGEPTYGHSIRAVYDDSNITSSIGIETGTANVTSDGTATLKANVTGAVKAVAVGFIFGQDADISENKGTFFYMRSNGEFERQYSALTHGTTYYYRAFAYVNGLYKLGVTKSFTIPAETNPVPEAVDLGLSVKWASFNVGATRPEEYGSFFDYDIVDEARANWGAGWRLPTREEAEELTNQCTRIWTSVNNVEGLELKGPNGNSIFLPAAGSQNGTTRVYVGQDGNYKTSGYAYLYFSTIDRKVAFEDDNTECSIRLVHD